MIRNAVRFVANAAETSSNEYSLAIAALALKMNKHEKGAAILDKLDSIAKRQDDLVWWSTGVETTAYVLLAMLENGWTHNPPAVANWLIKQRNSNGGFGSSQDTVVAVQALTKYALAAKLERPKMKIEVDIHSNKRYSPAQFSIVSANDHKLQTYTFPKNIYTGSFRAAGTGTGMAQISVQYNVAVREPHNSFKIIPTVQSSSNHQMVLRVCGEYTPQHKNKHTSMVLMEIALPSGYQIDGKGIANIKSVDGVELVETQKEGSEVIVYFDNLKPHQPICLTVTAPRTHAVAQQKPSYIKLYDYYAPNESTVEYYDFGASFCDICKGSNCGSEC